jgi:uncharacterized heparinase superfamily protein
MAGTRETLSRLADRTRRLVADAPVLGVLLGPPVPAGLAVVPHDPWPGDAEAGAAILQGRFRAAGHSQPVDDGVWMPGGAPAPWAEALGGFEWIRDLRALGGDQARRRVRALVGRWIDTGGSGGPAWSPQTTANRLSVWMAQHEFFIASADDAFRARVMDSLARQSRHLQRNPAGDRDGAPHLAVAKGLVFAGLCLPGHGKALALGLRLLDRELPRQVPADGVHVERSPHVHLRVLRDLIDLRALLRQARQEVPAVLQTAVERMTPALRFFRHGDGGLVLFNESAEDVPVMIDAVLAHADVKGRAFKSAPIGGFERIQCGRTVLVMDTGAPAPAGLDAHAHAGALSFELSVGRERLVVNCGAIAGARGAWRRTLAATAAHATVTVGDRNLAEVLDEGGVGRRPASVLAVREEAEEGVLVDASHDGYAAGLGTLHRRRLFVADTGEDVRGEETLEGPGDHPFAVRFHLHPAAQVSMIQNGAAALIRLPSGQGWRLRAAGGTLEVQESLYAGGPGDPRRTTQVVVTGIAEPGAHVVKWALKREKKPG